MKLHQLAIGRVRCSNRNFTKSTYLIRKYMKQTFHHSNNKRILINPKLVNRKFHLLDYDCQKKFIILMVILMQLFIRFTVTSTQVSNSDRASKLNKRLFNSSDDSQQQEVQLSEDEVKRSRRGRADIMYSKLRGETPAYKTSQTRIRFSDNLKRGSITPNGVEDDDHQLKDKLAFKDYQDKMIPLLNFSHLKSKRVRKMAPAYELWPNLDVSLNIVGPNRKRRKNLQLFNDEQFTALNQASDLYNKKSVKRISTIMNSRNVLPKPLTLAQSDTINHDSLISLNGNNLLNYNSHNLVKRKTLNSASPNQEDDAEDETLNNPETSEVGENNLGTNEMEDTSADAESETNHDSKGEVPRGGSDQRDINFNVFDSKQALASKIERRKVALSPVYPPGDLDRLYSDALLVYIKDFNEFIKS